MNGVVRTGFDTKTAYAKLSQSFSLIRLPPCLFLLVGINKQVDVILRESIAYEGKESPAFNLDAA
jgi:hypothetical protein